MEPSDPDAIRTISHKEFLQNSTKVMREAVNEPVMVCDDDGTPRMIISFPVVTDDDLRDF
jgi:hypothetical protein